MLQEVKEYKRIILIAGEMHSGKTTFKDMLVEAFSQVAATGIWTGEVSGTMYGIPGGSLPGLVTTQARFAEPLYQCLYALGVEKHREFMQKLSDLAKECFGITVFLDKTIRDTTELLKEPHLHNVVLIYEDCRYVREYEAVKKQAEDLGLPLTFIYVHANSDVRKQRNPDKFKNVTHNSEIEVPLLRGFANVEIDTTNGDMQITEDAVLKVLGFGKDGVGTTYANFSRGEVACMQHNIALSIEANQLNKNSRREDLIFGSNT